MAQHYSDPTRENDKWALPDVETFELTARECAERDEDMVREYMKDHRFRLASMNSRVREAMFDEMIEDNSITGGWFFWFCFPGCMPDSDAMGPYATQAEAIKAAQEFGE